MPVKFTAPKAPATPPAPPKEGTAHWLQRMFTEPLVSHSDTVKAALEKFSHPTKGEGEATYRSEHDVTPSALDNWRGMFSQLRGATTGSAGAVSPSLIAQGAALTDPVSAPAIIANTAIAGSQAYKGAQDYNEGKTGQAALDLLQAGAAAAPAITGTVKGGLSQLPKVLSSLKPAAKAVQTGPIVKDVVDAIKAGRQLTDAEKAVAQTAITAEAQLKKGATPVLDAIAAAKKAQVASADIREVTGVGDKTGTALAKGEDAIVKAQKAELAARKAANAKAGMEPKGTVVREVTTAETPSGKRVLTKTYGEPEPDATPVAKTPAPKAPAPKPPVTPQAQAQSPESPLAQVAKATTPPTEPTPAIAAKVPDTTLDPQANTKAAIQAYQAGKATAADVVNAATKDAASNPAHAAELADLKAKVQASMPQPKVPEAPPPPAQPSTPPAQAPQAAPGAPPAPSAGQAGPPPPAPPQPPPAAPQAPPQAPPVATTPAPAPEAQAPAIPPPVAEAGPPPALTPPAPPEPTVATPPAPESPIQATVGAPEPPTSPASFFRTKQGAAGQNYRLAQEAEQAGDIPTADFARDSRLIAGGKAPEGPLGEFIDQLRDDQTAGQLSRDLESIPPEVKAQGPSAILDWFSKMGSATGQATPSAAQMLALRTSLGLLGGTAGYKYGDQEGGHPIFDAALGATAGVLAPSLFTMPAQGDNIDRAVEAATSGRAKGLLGPYSVVRKTLGDAGGLGWAMIENPRQAGSILRNMLNVPQVARDFAQGVRDPGGAANAGYDEASTASKFFNSGYNPMSWAGRAMSGATNATKNIMENSGIAAEDSDKLLGLNVPEGPITGPVYQAIQKVPLLRFLSPFSKISLNALDRGWEHSPGGFIDALRAAPGAERTDAAVKAGIGTLGMGAAAYATPPGFVKEHPVASSFISAAGGVPFMVPALGSMAIRGLRGANYDQAMDAVTKDAPMFRAMQDLHSVSALPRNMIASYTAGLRPIAEHLQPNADPDTDSQALTPLQRLTYRALANLPGVRGMLPQKGGEVDPNSVNDPYEFLRSPASTEQPTDDPLGFLRQ